MVDSAASSSTDAHITNDPAPPSSIAGADAFTRYKTSLTEYTTDWISRYSELSHLTPEMLWADFTLDFSEIGIHNLDNVELVKLRELFNKFGVRVRAQRGLTRRVAIKEVLTSESCPVAIPSEKASHTQDDSSQKQVSASTDDKTYTPAPSKLHSKDQNTENSSTNFRSTGIDGLIKAYSSRDKYTGNYDDDLLGAIEVYEMTGKMCDLDANQKLKGIPVMLTGPALTYYATHLQDETSYDAAIDKLIAWFTSDEQRARLLQEWQSSKLSEWLKRKPEKSESTVFREMSAHLAKIQRQLHSDYRKDRFLKDALVLSADLPEISKALKENRPTTAHQANQRIAALLSDEPRKRHNYDSSAFYGLGQRFMGQAERRMKGRSSSHQHARYHNKDRRKLARVKGCWVCGDNHRARDHHTPQEIDEAIARLISSNAYVSMEDVADVFLAQDQTSSDNWESDDDHDLENENKAHFATEIKEMNTHLERRLSNCCFAHSGGYRTRKKEEIKNMEINLHKSDPREFKGIMIDHGANYLSMISIEQYLAYCQEYDVPANVNYYNPKSVRGVGGSQKCYGRVCLSIPFPNIGVVLDIDFHITDGQTPTILCLNDSKKSGFQLDIQNDQLSLLGKTENLELRNGLLWYSWGTNIALFSKQQLFKLHRSFGHPNVTSLYKLLKRAQPEDVTPETRKQLEEIVQQCKTCNIHASKPKRFKLTVGNDEERFNHCVAVDIMFINNKPILHVVDEATHFQAAAWLNHSTSQEVWKSFLRCWSTVYLGPPDYLRVDQGTNFVSQEFRSLADTSGITVLEAPVESPNTMSHVERYHGPLRSTYEKLEHDLPNENRNQLLQLAVHAVNNTVGPEGLCPTLCVFGALPRPARTTIAPQQVERAKAIDSAMHLLQKLYTKQKLNFALRYKGPYGKEQEKLDNLTFGAPVLVFREGSKKWEGPFKFILKEGETVVVQTQAGRRIFRSTVVKPDTSTTDRNSSYFSNFETANSIFSDGDVIMVLVPESFPSSPSSTSSSQFTESRKKELQGLMEKGVFQVVDRSSVPRGTRIYGTRFVDEIRPDIQGNQFAKSRLVSQNYHDGGARNLSTKSPTISRIGQRVLICIMACKEDGSLYIRDIKQAYTQSKSELERLIYLLPVKESGLPVDKIWLAKKPLYGIPEAGLHWYLTYCEHHRNALGMTQSIIDPCVFYKFDSQSEIPSVIMLQVDDSLGCCTSSFLDFEESKIKNFLSKPRIMIQDGKRVRFNGSHISKLCDGITLEQSDRLAQLSRPKNSEEAKSVRAQIQYIATVCRPDLCAPPQLLASESLEPGTKSFSNLLKLIDHCMKTSQIEMKFVPLDLNSLHIQLFSESSFGNRSDFASQLGFLAV